MLRRTITSPIFAIMSQLDTYTEAMRDNHLFHFVLAPSFTWQSYYILWGFGIMLACQKRCQVAQYLQLICIKILFEKKNPKPNDIDQQ